MTRALGHVTLSKYGVISQPDLYSASLRYAHVGLQSKSHHARSGATHLAELNSQPPPQGQGHACARLRRPLGRVEHAGGDETRCHLREGGKGPADDRRGSCRASGTEVDPGLGQRSRRRQHHRHRRPLRRRVTSPLGRRSTRENEKENSWPTKLSSPQAGDGVKG